MQITIINDILSYMDTITYSDNDTIKVHNGQEPFQILAKDIAVGQYLLVYCNHTKLCCGNYCRVVSKT